MVYVLWFRELVRQRCQKKAQGAWSVSVWRGLAKIHGPRSSAACDRVCKIWGNNLQL